MRKILLVGLIVLAIFTLKPFALVEASMVNSKNEVIVKYSSDASRQIIVKHAEVVVDEYKNLSMMSIKISDEHLQTLKNEGHIDFYEENTTFYTLEQEFRVANTSYSGLEQWNLNALNIQKGWSNGYTGKGVKIAIIDSGVANHPDLTIAGGATFVGDTYADDHGHGTHVAGIIAGKHNGTGIDGIAPDAEVFALKAIKSDGTGEVATVLQAIDWAIQHEMDIINLSFGDLNYSKALHIGVQKAADQGILIVAASGNEGNDSGTGNTVNYPARHKEVISVTSVNRQFKRSSFSGTGDMNDFAAPGEQVYSTYLNGSYATYSGTSMATPHITGLLALLMEQYPNTTPSDLRDGLHYIAEDLGDVGFDYLYGYGIPKFELPNKQVMEEVLNYNLTLEVLNTKINDMPNTIEKLAVKNEWNKKMQTGIKEVNILLSDFAENPTEQLIHQLTEAIAKIPVSGLKSQKQKEMDAVIATLLEPATSAVNKFHKSKTVYNYKKAEEELKKLPTIEAKIELEKELNKASQQFIHQATQSLVQYEKAQTLKNYNSAMNAIRAIVDIEQRTVLEKRIQKTVNNNVKKAKIRVANYEKKKTKANRNLAIKLVRELPDDKEKELLLKRLK